MFTTDFLYLYYPFYIIQTDITTTVQQYNTFLHIFLLILNYINRLAIKLCEGESCSATDVVLQSLVHEMVHVMGSCQGWVAGPGGGWVEIPICG